jgi:predicted alpha/beta superfamily hydrolase
MSQLFSYTIKKATNNLAWPPATLNHPKQQTMNKLIPLLLLLLAASCTKQKINPDFTREFSIHSDVKNRDYHIKVQLPEDCRTDGTKYSTVYVLDAFRSTVKDFEYVSKTTKALAAEHCTNNVIVVGIDYGDDRGNDYTPTATEGAGGDAARFTDFIEKELQPRIEREFPADTSRASRVLIGHSYGGLYGGYVFTRRNNVFGHYLMLSPSLWYDREIILQYEQAARPAIRNNAQLVYLGVGGTEAYIMPPISSLYKTLQAHYPATKSAYEVVPGAGHLASIHKQIDKALSFYYQNR